MNRYTISIDDSLIIDAESEAEAIDMARKQFRWLIVHGEPSWVIYEDRIEDDDVQKR